MTTDTRIAERMAMIEKTYREGFQDGFDHGNLSYKYLGVDEAWDKSCIKEEAALDAEKEGE